MTKNQRRNVVKVNPTDVFEEGGRDRRNGCKGLVSADTMQKPANIMISAHVCLNVNNL